MMGMEFMEESAFFCILQDSKKRCSPHSTLTHSLFYCRDSLRSESHPPCCWSGAKNDGTSSPLSSLQEVDELTK